MLEFLSHRPQPPSSPIVVEPLKISMIKSMARREQVFVLSPSISDCSSVHSSCKFNNFSHCNIINCVPTLVMLDRRAVGNYLTSPNKLMLGAGAGYIGLPVWLFRDQIIGIGLLFVAAYLVYQLGFCPLILEM